MGFSAVIVQLVLMRELLCAFSGNEIMLGIALGGWLLTTGIGSLLGRSANRLRKPAIFLVAGFALLAALPIAQVFTLRVVRDIVFTRGAAVGVGETVLATLAILLPYCIVSGCMLTLTCEALARYESRRAIGRVYFADSMGSIAGGIVFCFVLAGRLDHFMILMIASMFILLVGWMLCFPSPADQLPNQNDKRPMVPGAILTAMVMIMIVVAVLTDPDAITTRLQYPRQNILYRGNSPYGRLVVTETDAQLNFILNGQPYVSTGNIEQVEETAHYAMIQASTPCKVLLVGGGISGTAKEILKYGIDEITCVELDPRILDVGRGFLGGNLDDPRIRLVSNDGRLFIKTTDGKYDVVIIDAPEPATLQANRFYTDSFYREVKRILAPGGILCFALGDYANYISREQARMLSSARRTLETCYRNVLLIPGGRIFLLASDAPLHSDIARRLKERKIPVVHVTHSYLDAMLTPDRIAEVQRASNESAEINKDFSPALYDYYLRRWVSQFKTQFGMLEGILAIALFTYLFLMRPAPFAVFASGFAASALEIILLLGFQVLYGCLYNQIGLVVTMFMTGLAAGSYYANRRLSAGNRTLLGAMMFVMAGFSLALPLIFVALHRFGAAPESLPAVRMTINVLTLMLGGIAGVIFPLASQLQGDGAAHVSSRLYTADFIGASLGALLVSTLLIPLTGITGACALTALLNLAGGTFVIFRKG